MIPEGEALGLLAAEWLIRNDPLLMPLPSRPERGPRSVPSRYITKQVRAIVERRSAGTCEICGQRPAKHKIHMRVPYAQGGSNEADNIGDACWDCHFLVDRGVWVFEEFDGGGHPQFRFVPDALLPEEPEPPEVRERSPRYHVRRTAMAFG